MLDTTAASLLHNQAVALTRAGALPAAIAKLLEAIHLVGPEAIDTRTLKTLWAVAEKARDWKVCVAAGIRASSRDPQDYKFASLLVESLAACPVEAILDGQGPSQALLPHRLPSLSVVLVSQDDTRYGQVNGEYERAFARWPHERIRVKGARSMYDGYQQGFSRSTGDIVIFSHDDIEFAAPDFAVRLEEAIREADMVGVAGTTRITGPAMNWAGHPYHFGAITHKGDSDAEFEFAVMSLVGPHITGAQGLDGVFIAARRECVAQIGFDPTGFPGFHFYDLDFSYRAFQAGARLTIASDLGLIHHSRGLYDDSWRNAQEQFATKHGLPIEPPGSARHYYGARLTDRRSVADMCAKLSMAWKLTLDGK